MQQCSGSSCIAMDLVVRCAAAGVHASRVTASGQLGRQARQALPCTCAAQQTG